MSRGGAGPRGQPSSSHLARSWAPASLGSGLPGPAPSGLPSSHSARTIALPAQRTSPISRVFVPPEFHLRHHYNPSLPEFVPFPGATRLVKAPHPFASKPASFTHARSPRRIFPLPLPVTYTPTSAEGPKPPAHDPRPLGRMFLSPSSRHLSIICGYP